MTAEALPSPFDYLDYRRWLSEWFRAKKAANARYSFRVFAKRAGISSPALLHHVMEGQRNLTADTTEAFIVGTGIKGDEAQFFRLLVALDQTRDPDVRNQVWDQVSATRRFREARRIDGSAFAYLSNWALPAIRELAQRPDFRFDPAWVARQLRPPLKPGEAKRALAQLVELGMLAQDEDGVWGPKDASVVTPPEVTGLAVHNYHRGMLERATEAITAFEPRERHLIAITVAVPESLIPRLKSEANAFLERMMHLCDASTEDADRVMQMNLQLFPLSAAREVDS